MHLYAVKLAGVAPCLALRVLTVHAATRSAVALTQLPCTLYTQAVSRAYAFYSWQL